jgi:hypothetical protein
MTAPVYPEIQLNYFKDVTPSTYGVQTYDFEDGTESRRAVYTWGYKTKINLVYEGKTADDVASLMNFYASVQGTVGEFTLPISIMLHPSAYQTALVNLARANDTDTFTQILWRFEGPPQIDTQFTNIYNFNVSLLSMSRLT